MLLLVDDIIKISSWVDSIGMFNTSCVPVKIENIPLINDIYQDTGE